MEKTPEYALEAGIAVWVEDNQELVNCALRLGNETTSLGLVDTNENALELSPQKYLVLMEI